MTRTRFTFVACACAGALALGAFGASAVLAQQEGSGTRPTQPAAKAARSPDLIALQFYADWCAKCQAMAPAVEGMEEEIADQPVLIVTLDQTDKESAQAEYLVAALGCADLWQEHAGKTGYILLIDPESKRVVSRLTAEMNAATMTSAVTEALGTAERE